MEGQGGQTTGDLYLPGAASLLEQLDSRVMIILSDGRHLVGTLRSFDQYLNLVLENTSERIILRGNVMIELSSLSISIYLSLCLSLSLFHRFYISCFVASSLVVDKYCDMPLGLYIVRGDNIVLLGELDDELERNQKLEKINPEELAQYPDEGIGKLEWDFET